MNPRFLLIACMVLEMAPLTVAQTRSVPAPAPVSCTANVPKLTCAAATSAFKFIQGISSCVRSVEIVIADREAFDQERARLNSLFMNVSKIRPKTAERSKPKLLSSFDDDMMFELQDGGSRGITKVMVAADLFLAIKQVKGNDGTVHTERTDELDIDAVFRGQQYVMGFLEGAEARQVQDVAEEMERLYK